MKLKICGLTRKEDVLLAVENGATYLGFIFVADTPRALSLEEACQLIQDLPEGVHPVAVVLNEDPRAKEYLEKGFHFLQVHGGLIKDVDRDKQIPVYHVGGEAPEGKNDTALKLFDTRSGKAHGGTGKQFDLRLLAGAKEPYIVAGGFRPGNLDEVKALQPFAVDVSSGLEAKPRIKDPEKIKAFAEELWEQ